ncbi:hypothetical protein [Risungbinella massiliensis]|uniref:hypothetical protein n=1 Tax=Risungbinella massiliensis TaxID=1329796 RepID=UPI0005CC69E1|nr:hypothetical protein [Risungbinella massiliensis]
MVEMTLKGSHEEVIQVMNWVHSVATVESISSQEKSTETKCRIKLNQFHQSPRYLVDMKTTNGSQIQIDLSQCEMMRVGNKIVLRGRNYDIFA